jgi:hypothetical protein
MAVPGGWLAPTASGERAVSKQQGHMAASGVPVLMGDHWQAGKATLPGASPPQVAGLAHGRLCRRGRRAVQAAGPGSSPGDEGPRAGACGSRIASSTSNRLPVILITHRCTDADGCIEA